MSARELGITIIAGLLAGACYPLQPGSPDRWTCTQGEAARLPESELKAAVEGGDWIGQVRPAQSTPGLSPDLQSATIAIYPERIGLAWLVRYGNPEVQRVAFAIEGDGTSLAGHRIHSVCRNQHGETEVKAGSPDELDRVFLRFSPRGGQFRIRLANPEPGPDDGDYDLRRRRCGSFCGAGWIDQKPDLVY